MRTANTTCLHNTGNFTDFHLLGFQVFPELRPFLFLVFLIAYLVTVTGNVLIVVTVSSDQHLCAPMYYFLRNLSLLDICYSTNIAPTLLGGLLPQGITLSFSGCIAQLTVFGWFATSECFLLTLMAYDRYVAICYPLHYTVLMDHRLCVLLSISCWVAGFFFSIVCTTLLCQSEFSGYYNLDHYFCDLTPVQNATCSDTSVLQMEVLIMSFLTFSLPFLLIIVSYLYIILAILKIPSSTGRHRAFSTCSSHISVVAMYFGTLIALYVVPQSGHSLSLNKALSVLYTVLIPLLNPIIYTLRNKEIVEALRNMFKKKLHPGF
ncbi:olfactory receptor 11A1-like [Lissotriton helveticus]